MKLWCKIIFPVLFFLPFISKGQDESQLNSFREFIQRNKEYLPYDSSHPFISLLDKNGLNYLLPLYKTYGMETKLKELHGESGYDDDQAQACAWAGDYASASLYNYKSNSTNVEDSAKQIIDSTLKTLSKVYFADAASYILNHALDTRVMLFNETRSMPEHRAFLAYILNGLFEKGYRYFAVETLNPYANHSLKKLNMLTGSYTAESTMGEIIRMALERGYTLLSYEDTVSNRFVSDNERDSVRASHIAEVLRQHTGSRILMLTGYNGIEKDYIDNTWKPTAWYLKNITDVPIISIDQIQMTEGGDSPLSCYFYDQFQNKFHYDGNPAVIFNNGHPLTFKEGLLKDSTLYNFNIIFPKQKYRHNRPLWLSLNGTRREIDLRPDYKYLFLVQAYYLNEYNARIEKELIPADQTFITGDDGFYYLWLRKGKYRIIYRDKQYNTLGHRDIVVN